MPKPRSLHAYLSMSDVILGFRVASETCGETPHTNRAPGHTRMGPMAPEAARCRAVESPPRIPCGSLSLDGVVRCGLQAQVSSMHAYFGKGWMPREWEIRRTRPVS